MLTIILQTLLSNAVAASVLACVVYALAKVIRNQKIIHGLWIVVLLKLVAPSAIVVPFVITVDSSWLHLNADDVLAAWSAESPEIPSSELTVDTGKQTPGMDLLSQRQELSLGEATTTDHLAEAGSARTWSWSRAVVSALVLVWMLGTCLYVLRLLIRYVRFCRFLSHNEQIDEELISEGYDLAYKMGLKRPPRVRVLSGAFSPMLCGFGRSLTLILPLDLLHRLTPKGRATLIVHELAHYSRGDYLVRVLETFVTAVYWWHPVVWWVRRELEIVEEDCVDARVVAEFPGEARHYAEAILDAIDILCERTAAMPPLASGLGSAPKLKRRLTRIMTESPVASTSQRAHLAVMACGALLLPLQFLHFQPASSPALETGGSIVIDAGRSTLAPDQQISDVQLNAVLSQPSWCRVNSPNGSWIVVVDESRKCTLVSPTERRITELAESTISCLVFSPDSQQLATGSSDGRVLLFRAPDWRVVRGMRIGSAVKSIDWGSHSDQLAICTESGEVRVLNSNRLSSTSIRQLATTSPNCVRFSLDDGLLIVGSGDWKTLTGSALQLLDTKSLRLKSAIDLTTPVVIVRFGQREDEIITCDLSGQIILWTLPDLQMLNSQWVPKDHVAPLEFSIQADDSGVIGRAF